MKLYDGFTYFNQTIYFGLVVEPMLSENLVYRLVLVVSNKVQYPSI